MNTALSRSLRSVFPYTPTAGLRPTHAVWRLLSRLSRKQKLGSSVAALVVSVPPFVLELFLFPDPIPLPSNPKELWPVVFRSIPPSQKPTPNDSLKFIRLTDGNGSPNVP
ncbi:hypothetical protein N7494_009996 [Penicillium frequentans]|uniref:Uncharacterized protein n=1 Tax=Penicillium frequentans TaxID=3151616 RepID=A0AAD6CSQ4_9EURO|nr:hypothetical protein N7494_009996 [Penicillium glabrum]